MSIINEILLDSSIVVEYSKNTRTQLLDYLLDENRYKLFISETVVSEFTFYWLAGRGNKAPYTLKMRREIPAIIEDNSPLQFLTQFSLLAVNDKVLPIYLDLMQRYNLLPNDALIIATAKLHDITAVASYDPDFLPACQGEGIRLIREIADLA